MTLSDRSSKIVYTTQRSASSARAMCISLARYLESLKSPSLDQGASDVPLFAKVESHKADPESLSAYPAACVFVEGEISYCAEDTLQSTGSVYQEPVRDGSGDDYYLTIASDVKVTVTVHVWTNEDEVREYIVMALEDALNPYESATGFQLELPEYYGLRATGVPLSIAYEDTDTDNARRYRKAIVRIQMTCPHARLFRAGRLRMRNMVDIG